MTELSFARQFLTLLDARPIKYQPDYAADLRTLEITAPYTLPRMDPPMQKPSPSSTSSDPSSSSSTSTLQALNVSLKSLRNPPLDLPISNLNPKQTSILDLKKAVATEVGLPSADKVRILYRKKPCSDMKTVAEVLGDDETAKAVAAAGEGGGGVAVEFGVMVIGGVPEKKGGEEAVAKGRDEDTPMPDAPAAVPADAPVAVGPSGTQVLEDKGFWSDLEGFLNQRLKDAEVAAEATKVFEKAWKDRSKS